MGSACSLQSAPRPPSFPDEADGYPSTPISRYSFASQGLSSSSAIPSHIPASGAIYEGTVPFIEGHNPM
jgi:hypothetical protein